MNNRIKFLRNELEEDINFLLHKQNVLTLTSDEEEILQKLFYKKEIVDEFIEEAKLSTLDILNFIEEHNDELYLNDVLNSFKNSEVRSYLENCGYECFKNYNDIIHYLSNEYNETTIDIDELEELKVGITWNWVTSPNKLRDNLCDLLGVNHHTSIDDILIGIKELIS